MNNKQKKILTDKTINSSVVPVIDNRLFNNFMPDKLPKYVMGIDTYDKDTLTYCLSRKVNKTFEVILRKTIRDEKEFQQEVDNLAKYFNAEVLCGDWCKHPTKKLTHVDHQDRYSIHTCDRCGTEIWEDFE